MSPTVLQERRQAKATARTRHPTSIRQPDGRGPRRPAGRRTTPFLVLFLAVTALTAVGVIMVLSASAAASLSENDDAWSLFRRQLIWVTLGLVVLVVAMRVDYHRWRILAGPLLLLSFVLLALVAVPGVGVSANGASRWLGVGPLVFQPSELAKLALVLYVADLLARPSRPADETHITLRPVITVTAIMVATLMLQPHLGASIIVAVTAVAMLFLAGTPVVPLGGFAAAGSMIAAAVVMSSPWRRERLLAFMDPWADPLGNGYQPLQSLHAVTVGGLTGVGLGSSRAKWGFLPYAHTDFIFAVIAEELGLLGAIVVVGLFAVIGVTGLLTALRAPDRFGMLLAFGITTWIVVQAALNMGAVLALVPVLGVTLPFLSVGGSSLVVTMGAVGLLLNVARQGR
jgi:cell division protein FtsW